MVEGAKRFIALIKLDIRNALYTASWDFIIEELEKNAIFTYEIYWKVTCKRDKYKYIRKRLR